MKLVFISVVGIFFGLVAHADCGPETLDWPSTDGTNFCGMQSEGAAEGTVLQVGSETLTEVGQAVFKCKNAHWELVSGTCAPQAPFAEK